MQSSSEVKNKIQSLTESVWLLSVLTALAETGALPLLSQGMSLEMLEKSTNLPNSVLRQIFELLSETGFVTFNNEIYTLSPGVEEWEKATSAEKIISPLLLAFGLSAEFMKAARGKSLHIGWHYTDTSILKAQGINSEYIATACMPQNINIPKMLNQPGASFLDVGAGVGMISLRMCELYSQLRVVALEPADLPFSLAESNVKESKFSKQIELRKAYVQDIEDKDVFDLVWFPHVFFSDEVFKVGLAKVCQALKPGGILITNALTQGPVNQTLCTRKLINSLHGGLRTVDEVISVVSQCNFENIETFAEIAGFTTITASKRFSA